MAELRLSAAPTIDVPSQLVYEMPFESLEVTPVGCGRIRDRDNRCDHVGELIR